ncbi:MAG: Aromatic prenyltransferase 1, UbiA family [uncultured Acetobacteraceae bacterium]|uniref:Aromatic prenyltransferase 1, UbiA family n=1 Tax=uncultured Acetobacteraceae bacterium TaxID=169975 RepID=A0A6J4JAY3_9PROT|nr:MAG: Aromatic prenyltransferase 1, UbiA family [uncultured Acetobacteraceae bacterium]
MTPAVALRLGRVSNLPTVWTNAVAGVALAGVSPWHWATVPAALGLSFSYLGGMYLNDAFDRAIDARERPSRPIPSGAAEANTVFALGFALLLGGVAMLLTAACGFGVPSEWTVLAGLALGGAITGYNWRHKGNPLSPVWMGACRLLAYISAGLAATAVLPAPLLAAAAVSLCYLIGLTYIAKQETLGRIGNLWPLVFLAAPLAYGASLAEGAADWLVLAALAAWIGVALALLRRRRPGDIPRAVVSLIAGIALLDAMFLSVAGWPGAVPLALGCFAATLLLQRWVSGT